MKKRLITKNVFLTAKIAFLLSIFIAYSSCQNQKTQPVRILNKDYKESILESHNTLRTYMMVNQIPGFSIAVSHNNQLIWSDGIGYASEELKVPSTKETKYRIGKASTIFTVLTLAKLQDEGLIDLKKSFYDYIPEFPEKDFDFSPYLLAVNAAGFVVDETDLLYNLNEFKNLKEYVKFYKDLPQAYEPDTYFQNSDLSFALLGTLAEHITKTHYRKLIKSTLLDTLNLANTRIDDPSQIIENRSEYYHYNFIAQKINAPQVDLRFAAPVYGFLSTVEDLNKVGQILLEPGFFSQESLDLFFTPHALKNGHSTGRGFGWLTAKDENNRTIYAQLGSAIGGSSAILIYPEEKLVISACTNISDQAESMPIRAIANHFLKKIAPLDETN